MPLTYSTSLKFIASSYIKLLKVPVTRSTVEKEVEQNPYFPSLYSLAQTLRKYQIESIAYNISPDEFDLYEIETPFVAYVSLRDKAISDFVLITTMNEESLTFLYSSNKKKRISKDTFLGRSAQFEDQDIVYKGTLLKAAATERSGDPFYQNNKTAENISLIKNVTAGIGIVFLLTMTIAKIAPINYLLSFTILVLLKSIGLFTARLILVYENDRSNAFIKNLCSISAKTNCDAVLGSAASKIGGVSMGDVGIIYFSSTLIGLFLPDLNFSIKLACISMANIIVVPYIFFSVYYQWKVVKNWCPLCLTVQAIFLSEFTWSIALFWISPYGLSISAEVIYSILFCVSLPIIIWYYLKPKLSKAMNHDLYNSAYTRLLSNPDIFNKLLIDQPIAPTGWENIGIDLGNPAAEHVLIKVCNPYCKPCSEAHAVLHQMLKNTDNIRLKIIFVTRNNTYDKGRPIVRHLLQLAEKNFNLQEAIDAWYLNLPREYDQFAAKYPVSEAPEFQDIKIEAMRNWCNEANIAYTPTIFLNGYSLPENYEVKDLAYVFGLTNQ